MNADFTDSRRLKGESCPMFSPARVPKFRELQRFLILAFIFLICENPLNLRGSAFYSFRWLNCYAICNTSPLQLTD